MYSAPANYDQYRPGAANAAEIYGSRTAESRRLSGGRERGAKAASTAFQ